MGERGARREPATPDDIAEMARIARQAVEDGALGFTTSRTLNHRTSRGEPTPTLTAEADELVGIARALGDARKGVLQLVSDFIDVDDEMATFRRMAAESGRPLSLSLAQSPLAPDSWRRILYLIDAANADGVAMRAQVAARPVGVLMGLECTLHPLMTNPVYREVAELPLAERVRALADPGFKERVLAAEAADKERSKLGGGLIQRWASVYELGDPPDYEPDPSTSVAARAEREGRRPEELAYDLLLGAGGHALLYLPFLNYADGNLDAVGEMLRHPCAVPGLSDGGAHAGTICDVSFPTTLLTLWGRDRARGRMEIPFLVERQARATAEAVGLLDRGVLARGYRADVNLIDLDGLRLHRPEVRHDLPAGGRRLIQRADGYVATTVAGTVIHEHGEDTGALPGRLIRGAQPAPA
jgi:N-acyl-D-aspartate/D-glutamate deacylase